MSKIFITGSADGLGLLAAQALTKRGHNIYLHARNASRAKDAQSACPEAKDVFIAELSSASEVKRLAEQLNENGPWDAIVHNAGVMRGDSIFAVNTLAPYILTCLVNPPAKRVIFLSSSMHQGGDPSLKNIEQSGYSDTKLHNIMLAFWFARKFGGEGVSCNSLDPGWVPTKMGGRSAPDSIEEAVETYVALAEGNGETGKHWRQRKEKATMNEAKDEERQEKLIGILEKISSISPR
ncbi:short chain dehydrogenase [Bisporella sp. PMI_857]|nr:short chain dehydrogenase [Bisporella sp. PMI_857]